MTYMNQLNTLNNEKKKKKKSKKKTQIGVSNSFLLWFCNTDLIHAIVWPPWLWQAHTNTFDTADHNGAYSQNHVPTSLSRQQISRGRPAAIMRREAPNLQSVAVGDDTCSTYKIILERSITIRCKKCLHVIEHVSSRRTTKIYACTS